MLASFDLIKQEKDVEIIKNTHRNDGSIREVASLGFRQHLKDAVKMVYDMFDLQTDNEVLLFSSGGELIDEFKIIEVTEHGRGIDSGENKTTDCGIG